MSDPGSEASLKFKIRNLDVLPTMPMIAHKLLALKLDTEEGERQMLLLIEQDAQISAKLIGLANTPLLGISRKITSVKEAGLVLGLSRVRSVSMSIAIMSLMNKPAGRFDLQDLWLHSLGVAFGMLAIARAMPADIRPQEDLTFLAGILHDIGYLALAYLDSKGSDELHKLLAVESKRPALLIERELLGVTHDELGAELVRHWNLPDEIAAVVRDHHTLALDYDTQVQRLSCIVRLTEKLLPSFGIHEYVNPLVTMNDWQVLGIDPDQAVEITSHVTEQAEQSLQFFNHFV